METVTLTSMRNYPSLMNDVDRCSPGNVTAVPLKGILKAPEASLPDEGDAARRGNNFMETALYSWGESVEVLMDGQLPGWVKELEWPTCQCSAAAKIEDDSEEKSPSGTGNDNLPPTEPPTGNKRKRHGNFTPQKCMHYTERVMTPTQKALTEELHTLRSEVKVLQDQLGSGDQITNGIQLTLLELVNELENTAKERIDRLDKEFKESQKAYAKRHENMDETISVINNKALILVEQECDDDDDDDDKRNDVVLFEMESNDNEADDDDATHNDDDDTGTYDSFVEGYEVMSENNTILISLLETDDDEDDYDSLVDTIGGSSTW